MTAKITKAAAIADAEKGFGPVYRAQRGPQGWGYWTYDERCNGWRKPASTTSYNAAVASRAEDIAALAFEIMTGEDANLYVTFSGTVAQRLNGMLHEHRRRVFPGNKAA